MNWLRKSISMMGLIALTLSSASFAQEVDKTKPYEMIEVVADNLFSRLKAEKVQIEENPDQLKVVVAEELMPYVNHRYAALKLLGSHLKSKDTKKEDVNAFIDAFHDYLIASYAQVLTLYVDQSVEFENKKKIDAKKRIIGINVDVIDPPKPNINIEFKLRKNKKTNEWLAYDMIAEGISLLSSKQSEWNGQIRNEGIPYVAKELSRLSRQPIRIEGRQ